MVKTYSLAILFFSFLPIAQAEAEINCTRIGDDPYNTNESFFADGSTGAFMYNAYDGQRQALELQCDFFEYESHEAVVCARNFQRADGLTVEHYVIPKLAAVTSIYISGFVENSSFDQNLDKHTGSYQQITVSCE
jgi:hypothetical protein